MINEKVTNEKIWEFLQEMNSNNYERFNMIDSVIGRRIAAMEVKIDSIEGLLSSVNKSSKITNLHIEKMTSEEIFIAIKNMENRERHKLLEELFYEYFNVYNHPRVPEDWD